MRRLVLMLVILFIPFNASFAHPCDRYLVDDSKLGIGVLGRTLFGFPVLGIGSYVGAHHEQVLERMRSRHAVTHIEWLGEIRYKTGKNDIQILEANETSGFYSSAQSSLPMSNNSNRIPFQWRAAEFVAHRYDPYHPHLDPTLNAVAGNVRHKLANALAKFSAVATLAGGQRSLADRLTMIGDFNLDPEEPGTLVMWIVENLIQEQAIKASEVKETLRAVRLVSSPNLYITFIDTISVDDLQDEIQLISDIIYGRDRVDRISVLASYWPYWPF